MAERSGRAARVTACTVVARNYLPAARVLAGSYLAHHPGDEFVIAVIDRFDTEAELDVGYRVIGPDGFGIAAQDYLRMATAYSVTELATAVKPFVLSELRRRGSPDDVVIYLDPDIEVFAPMPEPVELAAEHQLVLTPHFLTPMPRDGRAPDETMIMGSGIFNLGFIATGAGSENFLDFWAQRLRHDAIVAPEQQLFTDQRWVDQVPALFPHTVLSDPGFNVAYWNLHERPLDRTADGTVTANGSPLRFFHFSGYRPEKPWLLSHHCAHQPRVLLSEHPLVRELCDRYGRALRDENSTAGGTEDLEAVPYGFATFADGTEITPAVRRLFRDGWIAAEQAGNTPPPHAFDSDAGSALRDWLTCPDDAAQAAAGLNRLAVSLWHSRTDLRLAFPQPYGEHAEDFRNWCMTSGVRENALPAWAVPHGAPQPAPPAESFGVNLAGYLTAELGVGEMGRIVHEATTAAAIDVVSVIEDRYVRNRTGATHTGTVGAPRYPVSLLAVNADQTATLLSNYPELAHDRYTIGLWAWELEHFPSWLHPAFQRVDEVWTVSEFCRRAIAEQSPVPVKTIPVPVRDPGEPIRRDRDEDEPTTFLFTFDFNSVAERKNPWGVVTAFGRAFGDDENVRLVLKAINGDIHPHNAERLRVQVATDERIELIERYLDRAELDELYRSSDCYVSLHRSEGFGLTLAEAMARGLPVISTDYSGPRDFLDERSGWLIGYTMVAVGAGNDPYHADGVWAEPDLDAAAAAMREVADRPEEARRRGRAAREHILQRRTLSAAAEWLHTELARAYDTWHARIVAEQSEEESDPIEPLRAGKEALRWRADSAAPSRIPLAPAMRKAVLRAVDHYDVHQREVMGSLVDGVEDTTTRLLNRLEALESRQAHTDALTARTQRKLGALQRSIEAWRPHAEHAFADLNTELIELRESLGGLAGSHARTDARLQEHEQTTHQMFAARDTRVDNDEQLLARVERDLDGVQAAARSLHTPVPPDADVALCDAGALLMPVDEVMWDWIRYHHSWERAEAALMAQLVRERPGGFLDVGAHVGYHALRLVQACSDASAIIAVEVDPLNFAFLQRNISVNVPAEATGRIHALQVAAWDCDDEVELVPARRANSGDHRVRPAPRRSDPSQAMRVQAVRLDGRMEIVDTTISVVKLDLQGRDHRALAGMTAVLERDRPEVLCEFCPQAIAELGDDPNKVLAEYREWGYTPIVVSQEGPVRDAVTDDELIRTARACETGFHTLWLRPS